VIAPEANYESLILGERELQQEVLDLVSWVSDNSIQMIVLRY